MPKLQSQANSSYYTWWPIAELPSDVMGGTEICRNCNLKLIHPTTCVCAHACAYASAHDGAYDVRVCVCVSVCMCVFLWARVWAHEGAGTRTCLRVCVGAHVCVCVRVRCA